MNLYLTFSDSAKIAEAAKNLSLGKGMVIHHSFFDPLMFRFFDPPMFKDLLPSGAFPANFLPLPAYVLSFIFKFFPANDATVIVSGVFLFLINTLLVFSIAKKLHSSLAGLIATSFFISNQYFIDYAKNFTSETLLIFEILLFIFLLIQKKPLSFFASIPLVLMFYTRQQFYIFLSTVVIFFFASFIANKHSSRLTKIFVLTALISLAVGISIISRRYTNEMFSPGRLLGTLNIAPGVSQGVYLRGQALPNQSQGALASKVLYHLYNFAKSPERLFSPVILFLFIFSMFLTTKNNQLRQFNRFSALAFLLFLFAASLTLPNARYVHPIIPLLDIAAAIALIEITSKLNLKSKYAVIFLTLGIVTLPTVGYFTLDARFRNLQYNQNQPPVYKKIADIMAQNIPQNKMIISNLDAWSAWYHGLTTMWFPLKPDMLVNYKNQIDYIVITNYLEQDADFGLNDWKEVVYSPDQISNKFLKQNFTVLKKIKISAAEVYENQEYQGTILAKKE